VGASGGASCYGGSVLALALTAIGFGAGSIPFGLLLARRRGVAIREHGSGNIGATNVARVLGAKLGALVLVLDAGKGALPVALALHLRGPGELAAIVGGAAIAGHCFSPWLGGKGGKGVATAIGVFAVLAPWYALAAVGVAAATVAITRVVALGSLAGIFAIAIALDLRGPESYAELAMTTAILLLYTHRDNLGRVAATMRKR
jgi:glycerol-3-phosphate acyltransferase PlsY